MLGLGKNGEVIEVTERSPYDMSFVAKKVPQASYQEVNTNFTPEENEAQNRYNDAYLANLNNVKKMRQAQQKYNEIKNFDVLKDYRVQIACEQSKPEIKVEQDLYYKAISQETGSPDFDRLEASDVKIIDYEYPSTDYDTYVPGSRVGWTGENPDSLPSKYDVSNTVPEGQMSGFYSKQIGRYDREADFGSNTMVKSKVRGMGDIFSDLLKEGEKALQTQVPSLVNQGVCALTSSCPKTVPPNTTSVVQIPSTLPPQVSYQQTVTSSIDPKVFIYGGAALLGTIVLLTLLRR